MSRARDMANLGSQAGSGLDASDLTTGTLGNTVQDNITRLGTVTTGTLKNTIHSDATFPAGMVVGTTVNDTSAFTTSQHNGHWNADTITVQQKTTRACKSGNTVCLQLVCPEFNMNSSTSADYFEVVFGFSATDPGSTWGVSSNSIIDTSKQYNGSGALYYYNYADSSSRQHGYIQQAYVAIPSDATYYFFYGVWNNSSHTHTISWGANGRPTFTCTEFKGSLLS